MKIKKLIFYVLLFVFFYNIFLKNSIQTSSLKINLTKDKVFVQYNVQIRLYNAKTFIFELCSVKKSVDLQIHLKD